MHFKTLAPLALSASLLLPVPAAAHCDGVDGPVVMAAQKALESGNPNPILIWVPATDEQEIRRAFTEALAVRRLGPEARKLADHYFFETLVRVHRAAEGAPYTGLKPAGRDLGPAVPLADKAVASGSEQELVTYAANEVREGIRQKFSDLRRKRNFRPDDLAAGREYVESYVTFVHYVEGLHQAAAADAAGHYREAQQSPAAHRE